jgi:hypothetical protein
MSLPLLAAWSAPTMRASSPAAAVPALAPALRRAALPKSGLLWTSFQSGSAPPP